MSIGISNDMGRIQKGDEALAHSPSHVAFAILLAAVLSVSMAYGVTLPFLPFLLERLMGPSQLSAMPWHAGLLTGLYTIAIFLLSPFWGILSDRMNWRVIPIGLFGSSISLVVLDDVSSMTTLYAARMAAGVFAAAVLPAALAYVARTCEPADKPRMFSFVASFTSLGFMLGPMVGGWLSSMVLSPSPEMKVAKILMPDSPFFVVASVTLLCSLVTLWLPAPRTQPRMPQKEPTRPADSARVRWALLLTLITVFGVTSFEVGVTLLGKQVLSLTPSEISQFFVVCSLVMIAIQIGFFPILIHRFSIRTLLLFSFILAMFGIAAIPYMRQVLIMDLFIVMIATGSGILAPLLSNMISGAAGQAQGTAFGQQASVANLGQAVAAATTGALFSFASAASFLLAASFFAAAACMVWRINAVAPENPESAL